jgi:hypothetical protein
MSKPASVSRTKSAASSSERLAPSYLVERETVADFRSLAQRLQGEHQEVAILCTGPWSPYSFVDVVVASSCVAAEAARG